MILENSSDIIESHKTISLQDGASADLLTLFNGKCIVLCQNALAVYKDEASVLDPLGNGLIDHTAIPGDAELTTATETYVTEYKAGYIGLADNKALLITPNHIQLFPDKTAALYNKDEICRLDLSS